MTMTFRSFDEDTNITLHNVNHKYKDKNNNKNNLFRVQMGNTVNIFDLENRSYDISRFILHKTPVSDIFFFVTGKTTLCHHSRGLSVRPSVCLSVCPSLVEITLVNDCTISIRPIQFKFSLTIGGWVMPFWKEWLLVFFFVTKKKIPHVVARDVCPSVRPSNRRL